jgi:hypothetical protein
MILFIHNKAERESLDSYFVLTDSGHEQLDQVDKGGFKIIDITIVKK